MNLQVKWVLDLKTGLGAISTVKTQYMILSESSPFRTKVRFSREESGHDFQTCTFPMRIVRILTPRAPSEGSLGSLFGPLGGLSGASGGLLGPLGGLWGSFLLKMRSRQCFYIRGDISKQYLLVFFACSLQNMHSLSVLPPCAKFDGHFYLRPHPLFECNPSFYGGKSGPLA